MAEEPINVRVARCLGYHVVQAPIEPFGWIAWEMKSDSFGEYWMWERVHDYLHDDAFCHRLQRDNHLDIMWTEHDSEVQAFSDVLIPAVIYGDLNTAILEWLCAAVAAGVEAVTP